MELEESCLLSTPDGGGEVVSKEAVPNENKENNTRNEREAYLLSTPDGVGEVLSVVHTSMTGRSSPCCRSE